MLVLKNLHLSNAQKLALILVLAAIVFALGAKWQLSKLGKGLRQWTFLSYVASEYFPDYRKSKRKWPSDLSELKASIEARKDFTPENRRLNLVLKVYNSEFNDLEVINKDEKKISYKVHFKDGFVTCESTQKSGFCE